MRVRGGETLSSWLNQSLQSLIKWFDAPQRLAILRLNRQQGEALDVMRQTFAFHGR